MGNYIFLKRELISRILFFVIIHLKKFLQTSFSGLPRNVQENIVSSIWPCSKWGLQCQLYYYNCGELLPSPFQPYLNGGIFSVALSLGFPLLGVIQHFLPVESGLSSAMQLSQSSLILIIIYYFIKCNFCESLFIMIFSNIFPWLIYQFYVMIIFFYKF